MTVPAKINSGIASIGNESSPRASLCGIACNGMVSCTNIAIKDDPTNENPTGTPIRRRTNKEMIRIISITWFSFL
jgi:hypothetical protein